MSRRAALITQADIARAIRAVKQAGPENFVIEITKAGEIRIVPAILAQRTPLDPPVPEPFARGLEIIP
jgi:hypothetical protein